MARRVGSPKELDSSATTAVKAPGSSVTPATTTASPGTFAGIVSSLRRRPRASTGDGEVRRQRGHRAACRAQRDRRPAARPRDRRRRHAGRRARRRHGSPSELVVPIESWPTTDMLRERIAHAVTSRGLAAPEVVVTTMDEDAIRALRANLRDRMGVVADDGHGHGHGAPASPRRRSSSGGARRASSGSARARAASASRRSPSTWRWPWPTSVIASACSTPTSTASASRRWSQPPTSR